MERICWEYATSPFLLVCKYGWHQLEAYTQAAGSSIPGVWSRRAIQHSWCQPATSFTTLAYYRSLSEVFSKRGIAAAERLDAVVLQMHEGAGSSQRVGLGLD